MLAAGGVALLTVPALVPVDRGRDSIQAIETSPTSSTARLHASTLATVDQAGDRLVVDVGLNGRTAAIDPATDGGDGLAGLVQRPGAGADREWNPTRAPITVSATPSSIEVTAAGSAGAGGTTSTGEPAPTTGPTAPSEPTTSEPDTGQPTTTAPNTSLQPTTAPTTGSAGGRCFQPIFRDDFNGSALGGQWSVYVTNGAHSPHAVRRAEAVSVRDGLLQITARNNEDGMLVSGGLRHRVDQTYGRYAVRVRTDPDLTNATSGVVLTWPTSNNQPRDGENNLYETLKAPGSRQPFYSFIHEPFDDRADGVSQKRFVHQADATQWQQITMEWTPTYLSVTRSGPGGQSTQTQRVDETAGDLITDASHFLSIQLDLFKGSFPDSREVKMQVDWVEISSYCGG
ncbi:MAG: glycoside hydrolase family 16 protein [Acidimicrobiales bacterium]